MMHPRRIGTPQAEHRLRETQRVNSSLSLADKFPNLKTLVVHLVYADREGTTKTGEVKYKVNVKHAKSVFSFVCPHHECVGGDFDLSEVVARAVSGRKKIAEGEIECPGHHFRPKQEKQPCRNLLRYKLSLGYSSRKT